MNELIKLTSEECKALAYAIDVDKIGDVYFEISGYYPNRRIITILEKENSDLLEDTSFDKSTIDIVEAYLNEHLD